MDLACFGIEFETCVCDKNHSISDISTYRDQLQHLSDASGLGIPFKYTPDPSITDYGVWMVTIDRSIKCGRDDSVFITSNSQVQRDTSCDFRGVELVSPKIAYTRDEYTRFGAVLEKVVLNPHFTYEINKTQGMHINVSHPDQDKLKMLKAWWHFEPIILTFVPAERRVSKFAVPLRERFRTIRDLENEWEDFFIDSEEPPAKYTALCIKPNRFEVRIIPANMKVSHITAWLSFCIRFVFASITKDVNLGAFPTFGELFEFINVDRKNPVTDIAKYFYSKSAIPNYMIELVKSGNVDEFRKQIIKLTPNTMLQLLAEITPNIPSSNLIKFIRILMDENHDSISFPVYIEIPENTPMSIASIFEEMNVSLSRAYEPQFYKEYSDFSDYDLSLEVLKTAVKLQDCDAVNAIISNEGSEIDWDDIISFNSEWLVDCYHTSSPPDTIDNVESWSIAKKIMDRYPGQIRITRIRESWVENDDLARLQFVMLDPETNPDYTGLKNYVLKRVCDGSTEILDLLAQLIGVIDNAPYYINQLFLCENQQVNTFLEIYFISDDSSFGSRILEKLYGMMNIGMKVSPELLKTCTKATQ